MSKREVLVNRLVTEHRGSLSYTEYFKRVNRMIETYDMVKHEELLNLREQLDHEKTKSKELLEASKDLLDALNLKNKQLCEKDNELVKWRNEVGKQEWYIARQESAFYNMRQHDIKLEDRIRKIEDILAQEA